MVEDKKEWCEDKGEGRRIKTGMLEDKEEACRRKRKGGR
jgi:hypothetical protein